MNFERSPFFIPRCARKLRTAISVFLETETVQRMVASLDIEPPDKRLSAYAPIMLSAPLQTWARSLLPLAKPRRHRALVTPRHWRGALATKQSRGCRIWRFAGC